MSLGGDFYHEAVESLIKYSEATRLRGPCFVCGELVFDNNTDMKKTFPKAFRRADERGRS